MPGSDQRFGNALSLRTLIQQLPQSNMRDNGMLMYNLPDVVKLHAACWQYAHALQHD